MRIDKPAMWVVGVSLLIVLATAVAIFISSFGNKTTLQLGDIVLKARTMTTEAERKNGMRGVSVDTGGGVLFVFENEEMWPLTTAGMKQPVDVIWLDTNKKVVEVMAGVESGDGENDMVVAKKRARYALVMEEGSAARFTIRPGKVATFELVK